jgi:leader peptidase (prepilin peptidase)/N-methyltransferase
MPPFPAHIFAFLFGSIVGSFLNVCIWRLPREESIVFPPSRCPACGAGIRPRDNLPILGWLLLRGRCRDCREPISPRYPLVELLTAVLFLLAYRKAGPTWELLAGLVLLSAMVVIVFIDLDHMIIPDVITLPGIVLGLLLTPLLPHTLLSGVVGAAVGGLYFYLAAVISHLVLKKEGMGGGDIKMAAMMGAFLGWQLLLVAIFLALLLGSATGITLLVLKRKERGDPIPFGPFLALGTVIAYFVGTPLLDWYLSLHR